MKHLMKCSKCGVYTIKGTCPRCKIKTTNPKPIKYSPDDRLGKYRREAKKKERAERGLI